MIALQKPKIVYLTEKLFRSRDIKILQFFSIA